MARVRLPKQHAHVPKDTKNFQEYKRRVAAADQAARDKT